MKNFLKGCGKFLKYFLILFFGSTLLFVVLYRFVNPPVTPLMLIRVIEQATDGQTLRLQKRWVSLDKISPNLPIAVISSEDNRFLNHHGFDMEAIEKAKEFNDRKKGTKVRGASTISQQTAKNVFLWPQRSWFRKGLEVYFTGLIETVWGKKRIMEVYLNVIETGKGVYGAESAARTYFGKSASQLSRGEAALIAAILPNPLKWNPANPTPYIRDRQEWILWNMNNIGPIKY
ncbi:MAG: monofunctional biosynthetic peptidoglycan transglycosylase [Bacteroidales bacterium]|nr:monofunctional biosynthetic peptidoglycan transglycosylase [Bacteroidales bacterium]MDD4603012.1 monofunctional biosynthetic peptidoglycan transglycosylase [Bacteroidales bacterium]